MDTKQKRMLDNFCVLRNKLFRSSMKETYLKMLGECLNEYMKKEIVDIKNFEGAWFAKRIVSVKDLGL